MMPPFSLLRAVVSHNAILGQDSSARWSPLLPGKRSDEKEIREPATRACTYTASASSAAWSGLPSRCGTPKFIAEPRIVYPGRAPAARGSVRHTFTRSLQLNDIPVIQLNGVLYREFLLGVNQSS
jgi:hypothetical protein